MKRVFLFLAVNFAIMILLGIIVMLLGITKFNADGSLALGGVFIIALIFGMGGSFISLAMSKWMAKMMMGVKIIETPSNEMETWLVDTVRQQAHQARIGMPEVGIFDSPDMNAFATGMSRNNSLVAVSTGLMSGMTREEVEAVLAHEVSHAANGDMVTMGLLQGVLNTFVYFFATIIGHFVDQAMRSEDDESTGPGIAYFVTSIVAQIVLGILASLITMWFSRQREFRADAGSAKLVGKEKMINALQRLQNAHTSEMPDQMAALGISSGGGMSEWFTTHPPLEKRIEALRTLP